MKFLSENVILLSIWGRVLYPVCPERDAYYNSLVKSVTKELEGPHTA